MYLCESFLHISTLILYISYTTSSPSPGGSPSAQIIFYEPSLSSLIETLLEMRKEGNMSLPQDGGGGIFLPSQASSLPVASTALRSLLFLSAGGVLSFNTFFEPYARTRFRSHIRCSSSLCRGWVILREMERAGRRMGCISP